MKKLYVSCPVTGRKYEDVMKSFEQMHKIAEIIFDEKLEVVNSPRVIELKEVRLDDLAAHFKNMAEADYFIGVRWFGGPYNHHCFFEADLAERNGLKCIRFDVEHVAPDYEDIIREWESKLSVDPCVGKANF